MRGDALCFRYRPTRHVAKIPCQLVRERDFRLIGDQMIDLSTSGVLVTPADPVLTGERLILSFRTPSGMAWIDTEVTVARVVHGRRPCETSRMLGLEFEQLDLSARRLLARELDWLPVAPPAWRPGRRKNDVLLRRLIASSSRPVE